MHTQKITAVSWATASCLFLWLFSFAQGKEFSATPEPSELIESFIFFSFMLLGGGICYHFFTEILSAPYTPDNEHLWKSLMIRMALLMFAALSVPAVILILRDNLADLYLAKLLSLVYLILVFGASAWKASSIEEIFKQIRSYKRIKAT
ncbi:hypothetical protein [Idiomarina sp. ST10R2A5]|uniref:hypothetical protein n=1 Tax=Idiomarina sp. ST10R2A5 TaxID=3418368 RepID=UPI003EC832DA